MDAENKSDTDAPAGSAEMLRDAFDAIDEGMAIFDANRRLVLCNEVLIDMLRPVADLLQPGLAWEDLLHAASQTGLYADPDGQQMEWQANAAANSGGHREDVTIRQSDGRVFRVGYNPTSNGGFVVTRSDITEEHLAEARVRDRETLLSLILETNPTAVVMARMSDGLIIYRSPAALSLFGDTTHAGEHYINDDERANYIKALRKSGRVDDYRSSFKTSDGRIFKGSVAGGITEYNGQTYVVSTVVDISEHFKRDSIIQQVVEACPAPILMTHAETGDILFKSAELEAMFGPSESTLDFYDHPDDRKSFLEALRRNGTVHEHKSRFRNADGDRFTGAVSARLIQYNGQDVIVSFSRDMTQQLEIEDGLNSQREQLFQTEKMSALGGVLASVAHELNNPLSVVVGHAQMLLEESNDPGVIRQTKKIGEAAERCAKIVKSFMTMARQEPANREIININELITTAAELAQYFGQHSSGLIQFDLDPGLPEITGDPEQLTQALVNLLLNSEQAVSEVRDGRISVRSFPKEDGVVRIIIEDNGPGIPSDIRARVFEPFFTTKGVGTGTGIGLAYTHRVVTSHRGQITIDPSFRTGARLVIDLPCGETAQPGPHVQTLPAPSETGPSRILVIDDEPDVADLTAEVLERGGYDVTTAYSGAKAIEIMRKTRFDAIVSDLNMPGIDGRGFFETVQRDFPEMLPHTGFITGDTMGRASQTFLSEVQRPFIEKPVAPGELRDFVGSLLQKED